MEASPTDNWSSGKEKEDVAEKTCTSALPSIDAAMKNQQVTSEGGTLGQKANDDSSKKEEKHPL